MEEEMKVWRDSLSLGVCLFSECLSKLDTWAQACLLITASWAPSRRDAGLEEVSTSPQPSFRLSQFMLHLLWPSRNNWLVYRETCRQTGGNIPSWTSKQWLFPGRLDERARKNSPCSAESPVGELREAWAWPQTFLPICSSCRRTTSWVILQQYEILFAYWFPVWGHLSSWPPHDPLEGLLSSSSRGWPTVTITSHSYFSGLLPVLSASPLLYKGRLRVATHLRYWSSSYLWYIVLIAMVTYYVLSFFLSERIIF